MTGEDKKLQELFEAANRDTQLKSQLLAAPQKVAEEWGVKLEPHAADRLAKLGAFAEMAHDIAHGSVFRCDPRVCYPIHVWLRNEAIQLIRKIVFYQIFYPPSVERLRGVEQRVSQNLGLAGQMR